MRSVRIMGIGMKITTPIRFIIRCVIAIFITRSLRTIAAMKAVMVVPIFDPRIKGMILFSCILPVAAKGTTTEVVTELDWMAAVNNVPKRKDFGVFSNMNYFRCSCDAPISKREITLEKNLIDEKSRAKERKRIMYGEFMKSTIRSASEVNESMLNPCPVPLFVP